MRFLLAPLIVAGVVALFLGCSAAEHPPAAVSPASMHFSPPEARDEQARPVRAARIVVLPEALSQDVKLRDARGAMMCALPCTAFVRPPDGKVWIDMDDGVDRHMDIPDAFAERGGSVTALVHPQRGSLGAALGLGLGSLGPLGIAAPYIAICVNNYDNDFGRSFCAPVIGLAAVGVAMLTAGVIFGLSYHRARIELEVPSREVSQR